MRITKARINTMRFIISESIRIDDEIFKALKNKNYNEFLQKEYGEGLAGLGMSISSPNDFTEEYKHDPRREIKLSNKSKSAILHMLNELIKEVNLEMNSTTNEFYIEFKKIFYNHFFLGDGNIDHDGCLKILNEVVNRIKDSLLDEDFYFPILANGLEKDEINLGIASIIPKENIFSDIQPNFTTDVIELAEEFCNSQLHPYKHFLKITIKNCSKERRKYLSKQIANFIVGIIQLFSEHFQIDSDVVALSLNPYPNYESFYITNNDDGYNYCFSSKGTIVHSAVFWQKFKQENASELGSIIKQIIIHATTPKSNPVLVDRLIDAIFIFRSAMQDNDDSSKIVKLTTALERLVNTQKDNITSTFISRVTLLLNMYHKDNSDWSSIAKEMYNYRSEIVHGSWSLYRQTKPLYASRYSELTSKALISACIGFFHVGLKREDDIKLINSFYDYLSKNNQS